jgi:hypothetical protein
MKRVYSISPFSTRICIFQGLKFYLKTVGQYRQNKIISALSLCAKDAILTPENVKPDHISGSTNVVLGTAAFLHYKKNYKNIIALFFLFWNIGVRANINILLPSTNKDIVALKICH